MKLFTLIFLLVTSVVRQTGDLSSSGSNFDSIFVHLESAASLAESPHFRVLTLEEAPEGALEWLIFLIEPDHKEEENDQEDSVEDLLSIHTPFKGFLRSLENCYIRIFDRQFLSFLSIPKFILFRVLLI